MINRLYPADRVMQAWTGIIAFLVIAVVVGAIFAFATDESAPDPPPTPAAVIPTATQAAAPPASALLSPREIRALGFDALGPVPVPDDNPMSDVKVELGKLLFFDTRMSNNSALSCASCHQPAQGWGDGIDLNFGYTGTPHWRNSQTIINTAYHPKLFWAGESLSLESQAKSAWTGATGQNLDSGLAEQRLLQVPEYVRLFFEAFGAPKPTFDDALRAVAAFERTIVSQNVPFDRHMEGDESAMSDSALRGLELFAGDAGCSACHSGPLFTDQSFHAVGVPENEKFEAEPLRQVTLRYQFRKRGVSEEDYRAADGDLGLFYTTKQDIDRGKFRTPTLREVGQTGPYMHNGVLTTLADVVQFYNAGGGDGPNKSPFLEPLGLNEQEVADIVAFLESLTGDPVIVEAPEFPPYSTVE